MKLENLAYTVVGAAICLSVLASRVLTISDAHASPQGVVTQAMLTTAEGVTRTREVLVLASAATETCRRATGSGGIAYRRSCEVFNNGPNTIWCALNKSGDAAVNTSRPVLPGKSWAADLPAWMNIYCRAATADQVTTAATIVSEME